MSRFGAWASLALVVACRTDQTIVTPDPHLQRMLKQEKVVPYDDAPQLPGGTAMQEPPEGTLPVNAVLADPAVTSGASRGRYVERIPVRVERALVEMGRTHFETFCAACHGITGDGVSIVADKMALRKPPDLNQPAIRGYAPGRIFTAIREGYGLMPSYAVQLSVEQAWGVVAYVNALQLARSAPVAELPATLRSELARRAP
jgi:mono/diheme cytochrome c family protein